jgi:serine/threonine-protein kinase
LQILRDGKELPRAAWTASFPLDPGPHKIEVKAPGKEPWSLEISLPYEGTTRTVTLPGELKSTAPPAASSSAPAPPPPPASVAPAVSTSAPVAEPPPPGGNHLAYGLGAVGLVGLGVGTFFGLRAISRSNDANERCPETRCKDPGVVDLSKDASRDATISNVGLVIGVLGLGAGVGLLLLGPEEKGPARSSSRASVRVGATPLGATGLGGGLLNLGGEF